MRNAKHTPGPWKHIGNGIVAPVNDPKEKHGEIDASVFGDTVEQNRANGNLIAAAPEMLEACKVAFAWSCTRSETRHKWTASDQKVHEVLKRAIAKAEGGE